MSSTESSTVDTIKNNLSSTLGHFTELLTKKTGVNLMDYMGIFIATIIASIVIVYVYKKFNLDDKNCRDMNYQ